MIEEYKEIALILIYFSVLMIFLIDSSSLLKNWKESNKALKIKAITLPIGWTIVSVFLYLKEFS